VSNNSNNKASSSTTAVAASASSSSSSASATGLLEPLPVAAWDNDADADASDLDMWGDIDRELEESDQNEDLEIGSGKLGMPGTGTGAGNTGASSTATTTIVATQPPSPSPSPSSPLHSLSNRPLGESGDDDEDDEEDEFAEEASRYTFASVSTAPVDLSQTLVDDLQVELQNNCRELEKLVAQKAELENGIQFRDRFHALGPSSEDTARIKELMDDRAVRRYYDNEIGRESEAKERERSDKDKAQAGSGDRDGDGAEIPPAATSTTSDTAAAATTANSPGTDKGWLASISEVHPLLEWVKWIAHPLVSGGIGVVFLLVALAVILPLLDSSPNQQPLPVTSVAGTGAGTGVTTTATAQAQLQQAQSQQTAVAATVQSQQQQQATVAARTSQTQTAQAAIASRTVTASATTLPATTARPQGTRTAVVTPTVRSGPCIEDSGARGGCLPPDTLSISTRSVKWTSGEILRYPLSSQPLPGYTFVVESPSKGKLYHYGSYPGEQPGNVVLFGVYDDLNPIIERLNVNDEIQVTDRKGGIYTYRVLRWSDFSTLAATATIAGTVSAASSTPLPPTPTATIAGSGQGGLSASQATATALANYGFDPPDRITDKSDISLLARPEGTSNGVLTLVSLPKDGDTVEKPDPNRRAIRAMFINYAPARPTPAGTPVGNGGSNMPLTPQVTPTAVSTPGVSGQPTNANSQPQTPRG
jgi:hypothetical protein